jgi:hypothetical protein
MSAVIRQIADCVKHFSAARDPREPPLIPADNPAKKQPAGLASAEEMLAFRQRRRENSSQEQPGKNGE